VQKPGSMVAFSARSWNAKLSPDVSAETHLSRRLPSGGDGARLALRPCWDFRLGGGFRLKRKTTPVTSKMVRASMTAAAPSSGISLCVFPLAVAGINAFKSRAIAEDAPKLVAYWT